MNALQGLKQDWNNLRLSFTSPSKAEISASIEKIQRLDFWKNLTTTLSISLMPASVTVPFLAPYRKRDGTTLSTFHNYASDPDKGVVLSAIGVPLAGVCGIINGVNLGTSSVTTVIYSIATTAAALAALAALTFGEMALIIAMPTLLLTSRILQYMRNIELAKITERNGGQIPRAIIQACPDSIQWHSSHQPCERQRRQYP